MTAPLETRYYAYIKKSIRGPFFAKDAALITGFTRSTLVCPEKALGQWTEAVLMPDFQSLIETPPQAPVKPKPPRTAQAAEEIAARSLLEKAIAKNSSLERDVRELRKSYNSEKTAFDAALKKKDWESRAIAEKLRRNIANTQPVKGEHPSWEMLYKTLKKRSEDKISEITQTLSEKSAEMLHLKEAMHAQREAAAAAARQAELAQTERAQALQEELKEVKSQLEEKDMLARTLGDNLSSLLGKNEEFQHIMLDERRDAEEQSKKFCEEIGSLRADLSWRDQELGKIRAELAQAINQVKEFEAVEGIKSREQEELYGVLSSKLRILSGYFENLESRVKFAFRKA
ncbi:MAG: hypothetical protein A2234_01480 [Elusimicrobia bacterium RIFOXYA2_FULL_58_8]|nr:MAG: hypothetical protein A2285_03880 [Elusimicrobia bacterium RIFOXYA12_FULL_57_11]OGS17125.1 MAG: hypothetical protein A2234_01480 [Elusimicrobia bacterium RIFOXYA2_FULL_58_8]